MTDRINTNYKSLLAVVRNILKEPGQDRNLLFRLLGDTIYTPNSSAIFSQKESLFDTLFDLGWIEERDGFVHPLKWISRVGLCDGEVFILRDIPSSRLSRKNSNYEWSDETSDFFECFGEAEIRDRKYGSELLDLCTGSGSLAVCSRKINQGLKVVASDLNNQSKLDVQINDFLNDADNCEIDCVVGNLWEPVESKRFDLILTVPPFSLSPQGEVVSRQFSGGEFGDSVTSEVILNCHRFLKNEESKIQMLVYTLGNSDGSYTRLHKLFEEQKSVEFQIIPLPSKKVWRFKHSKAFTNGMPVEYMISRLGDPFKEEFFDSRSRTAMNADLDRLEKYELWISRLKREGWTNLWYCGVIGTLKT